MIHLKRLAVGFLIFLVTVLVAALFIWISTSKLLSIILIIVFGLFTLYSLGALFLSLGDDL